MHVTSKHIETGKRSRIIETSTRLRSALLLLFGVAITIGGTGAILSNPAPHDTMVGAILLGTIGLIGFALVCSLVWFDATHPGELDFAIIDQIIHISAMMSLGQTRVTKVPLKDIREVRYSAIGRFQIRVEGRKELEFPTMGTDEMRERRPSRRNGGTRVATLIRSSLIQLVVKKHNTPGFLFTETTRAVTKTIPPAVTRPGAETVAVSITPDICSCN